MKYFTTITVILALNCAFGDDKVQRIKPDIGTDKSTRVKRSVANMPAGLGRKSARSPQQNLIGMYAKNSFHEPSKPKYTNLLQMIKPIIPNAFPKPKAKEVENPNLQVVKTILNTTEEMNRKLDGVDPHRKALLEKVIQLARQLLGKHMSTGEFISDSERDKLLLFFNDALRGPKAEPKLKSKAPFSKLGEDGFEDVDHQSLAMEIKRLAVSLTQYLKESMRESIIATNSGADLNDPAIRVRYETDNVLTQTTAMLAKLHRAILRNHHHILMVIGNFAGNAASAIPTPENDMPHGERSKHGGINEAEKQSLKVVTEFPTAEQDVDESPQD